MLLAWNEHNHEKSESFVRLKTNIYRVQLVFMSLPIQTTQYISYVEELKTPGSYQFPFLTLVPTEHNSLALSHALFSVCSCGSPCLNGGKCSVGAANTPLCTCSFPYTGTFCEKGQCSINNRGILISLIQFPCIEKTQGA